MKSITVNFEDGALEEINKFFVCVLATQKSQIRENPFYSVASKIAEYASKDREEVDILFDEVKLS